jgi:ABC-2 type transport system permease protein
MTVFKGILLHFWKYKYMIISLTAIFFGFALLFSANHGTDSFESESLDITVVDPTNSEISDGLIKYLQQNNNVEVLNTADIDQIQEDVFLQKQNGALIIDDNIDEAFKQGEATIESITDPRDPSSLQLDNEVNKFFTFLNADAESSGSVDTEHIIDVMTQEIDVQIADPSQASEQDNFQYMKMFTNFAGYWIMLFMLMLIGNIMTEFNKPELKQRVNVSPYKTSSYSLQLISAQGVVAVFIVLVMFLGGIFIQADNLEGIPLGKMFVAMLLISLFTLALHYVIGALTTNKYIINGLANFISLGMAFISGIMIPPEVMGESVQNVAQFLPLYHFTQIYAEPDITWGEAMYPITVLLLFSIAMIVIGMILENKRKSSAD